MNTNELLNDKKELNNVKDILKDTLQADPKALERLDSMNLDMDAIKTALTFLYNNPKIGERERNELITESWRVNFRDRPPSPEEFLSEKYLGPVATHTYDRIKKRFLEFTDPTTKYRNLILYPHVGWGKLITPESVVLTPRGPKEIQNINEGDEICDSKGNIVRVIKKQKFENEKIYKVVFNDERFVYAGANHFWKAAHSFDTKTWDKETKTYIKGLPKPCWKIITTEEILNRITEKRPLREWVIPLTKPAVHNEILHVISPYALGAYLGDGCFSQTCNIVGDDYEIHERILKENPDGYRISDNTFLKERGKSSVKYCGKFTPGFKKELIRLGLENKKCNDKFIPTEYLYDSVENRIALLQGLMDTDGTVNNNSELSKKEGRIPHASFWTSSKQLNDNICTLVRGLGGIARSRFYPKGGPGTCNYDAYCVTILFPDNQFGIFSLRRKQDPIDQSFNRERKYKQQRKPQYLHFKSIEETNLTTGYCIETDGDDHLFLCNDYIVTHNSYLSVLITLYFTTYISLMRNPWKFYGLNPSSIIVQFLCSYSLKKSSELLLEPFNNILEAAPYFEKVRTREKMTEAIEEYERKESVDKIYYTTASPTSELSFTGGSNIKLVSNPQGLLGVSCVGICFSELAFFTQAGKSSEYIMELYNKGKQRVESRFHNVYSSYTILDSSPNSLDNAIDQYINYDAPKDPSNMIIRGSMWETMPENYDLSETFKVYTGGQGNPPRILENGDPLLEVKNNPKIIEVPESERQFFIDDITDALKDRAGIPSGSANSLIYDYDRIEAIFNNGLRNMYEDIHAPAEMNPDGLIWNQIKDQFFKYRAGEYEFYYKPRIPRCVAVDQSYATDMMGISMGHVERYLDTGELIYVVDFTIAISPQKDSKSNLESVRKFIEDLKYKGHINIAAVGFDSFESQTTIQNLEREGFNVKKVSADKSMDPYLNMVALINSGRLAVGRNIFLKNNLKSLNVVGGGTGKGKTKKLKIDHDDSREVIKISSDHKWETSPLGMYSKDISDSMVDMIELCRSEFPIAEEQWWGPVKQEDFTGEKEKASALNKLNNLFNKMGIK